MTDNPHLTEDERQALADEALSADRRADIESHVARCDECSSDVSRLRDITMRYRTAPVDPASVDDLWPSIRARIDARKVVPLAATASLGPRRWIRAKHVAAIVAFAAVVVLTVVLVRPSHRIAVDSTIATTDTSALRLVADSVKSYQDEARTLLNRLELQRAMMRPEAAASIDRDLKVIDQAIAELQIAIQNDPRNPALRQLLAASYRQKVDLLKRANDAS